MDVPSSHVVDDVQFSFTFNIWTTLQLPGKQPSFAETSHQYQSTCPPELRYRYPLRILCELNPNYAVAFANSPNR